MPGKNRRLVDIWFRWPEESDTDELHEAVCQLGEWNGVEDDRDQGIFYYFDDGITELKGFMKPNEEFVIKRWEYQK